MAAHLSDESRPEHGVDDYVRRPARRAATKAVLYTTTGALFFYGTLTIVRYR